MTTWLIALLALTLGQADGHILDGRWVADIAASKLHAGTAVRSIALTFVVTADRVRISDEVVSAGGAQVGHGSAEFTTDGQPHANDALLPGLVVQARWASSRRLETVLTRRSGVVERVSYEVSPDGLTLTNTTDGPLGQQVIVFRRAARESGHRRSRSLCARSARRACRPSSSTVGTRRVHGPERDGTEPRRAWRRLHASDLGAA